MEKPPMPRPKPDQVKSAQLRQDTPALSAMGSKGSVRSELAKIDKKALERAKLNERIQELAKTEVISPEGDVLPPN